jgi:hypothetical protein
MVKGAVIGFILVLVILAGIVVIVLAGFYGQEGEDFVEDEIMAEEAADESVVNESEENVTVVGDDFPEAEEIHWGHMPLIYKINDAEDCEGNPLGKMKDALDRLESATDDVITFEESDADDVDIEINCISGLEIFEGFANNSVTCEEITFDYIKIYIDPIREGMIDEEDYLVNVSKRDSNVSADETVFEVCYIDSGNSASADNYGGLKESDPVIVDGVVMSHKIHIFVAGEGWNTCANFPAREMHELLHGFGFKHSAEPQFDPVYGWPPQDLDMLGDVMFRDRYCVYQRVLDEKYPSCLKRIYTGEEEESCGGVMF